MIQALVGLTDALFAERWFGRFKSTCDLTTLKFDAKQIGFIIGTSASNFRKVHKSFLEEVRFGWQQ